MNYSKYCYLTLICFSSCLLNPDKKEIVKKFKEESSLKGRPITTKVPPQSPYQVFISGNKLISVESQSSEDIFRVYEVPSFQHLLTGGSIPKNLSVPDFFSMRPTNEGFRLWDHGDKILKYFSLGEDSITLSKQEILSLPWSPITGLISLNDSIFIAENPMVDNDLPFEHVAFNHYYGDRVIKRFGSFPDIDPSLNSPGLVRNFRKVYIVKPDGSKFIAMYQYYRWFKVYDSNFNLIKEVVLDAEPTLNKDQKLQFVQGYGSDNYIYILCFDKEANDVIADIKSLKPTLTIWNWDGLPIARYHLDKPVVSIAVSESLGKIYASSLLEPKLFEFDLPVFDSSDDFNH